MLLVDLLSHKYNARYIYGPYTRYIASYTRSFSGIKRPGRGVYHPPSSAVVKETVDLYLYSPSGPSWPVLWRTLPLPLPLHTIHFCIHHNFLKSFVYPAICFHLHVSSFLKSGKPPTNRFDIWSPSSVHDSKIVLKRQNGVFKQCKLLALSRTDTALLTAIGT